MSPVNLLKYISSFAYGYQATTKIASSTRTELLKLREKRFRKLLHYAFDHSDFYRELYRSNHITKKDLDQIPIHDLPTVTKTEIQQNFDQVVTDKALKKRDIDHFLLEQTNPMVNYKDHYHILMSSGSTGEPAVFCYNPFDWMRGTLMQKRVTGPIKYKRKVAIYGVCNTHAAGVGMSTSTKRGALKYFYDTRHYDISLPFSKVVQEFNTFKPDWIFGYCSALEMLAEQKLDSNLNIEPECLFSGAEPMTPRAKFMLKKAFKGKIIDNYASAEFMSMGYGDVDWNGLYLHDDNIYIEPQTTHSYITNLFNYTQPLIRYKFEDIFNIVEDTPQNIPFTFVRPVKGKQFDNLHFTTPNGEKEFVSCHLFVEMYIEGASKFQFHVRNNDLTVNIVCKPETDFNRVEHEVKKYWKPIFDAKNIDFINLSVKQVNKLDINPKTGKFDLMKIEKAQPHHND